MIIFEFSKGLPIPLPLQLPIHCSLGKVVDQMIPKRMIHCGSSQAKLIQLTRASASDQTDTAEKTYPKQNFPSDTPKAEMPTRHFQPAISEQQIQAKVPIDNIPK